MKRREPADPGVIAAEIVQDLQAALDQFAAIAPSIRCDSNSWTRPRLGRQWTNLLVFEANRRRGYDWLLRVR